LLHGIEMKQRAGTYANARLMALRITEITAVAGCLRRRRMRHLIAGMEHLKDLAGPGNSIRASYTPHPDAASAGQKPGSPLRRRHVVPCSTFAPPASATWRDRKNSYRHNLDPSFRISDGEDHDRVTLDPGVFQVLPQITTVIHSNEHRTEHDGKRVIIHAGTVSQRCFAL
jgi:hypothetical protein